MLTPCPVIFGYPTKETEQRKERGSGLHGGFLLPSSEDWGDHAWKDYNHEWAEEPYPWGTSTKARNSS